MNQLELLIEANLIKDFSDFADSCSLFAKQHIGSYRRVSFDSINGEGYPFEIDVDACVHFIEKARENSHEIKIQDKLYGGRHWSGNDIFFPFTMWQTGPEFGSREFLKYREWRDNLEYNCKEEFWNDKQNVDLYNLKFAVYDVLSNVVLIKRSNLQSYNAGSRFLYNANVWLEYLQHLIDTYFPDFIFNARFSTKKIKRYLRESEHYFLGFEYDESAILKVVKSGTPSFSDYFNIVLFDKSFYSDQGKYNVGKQVLPLSLGILGNPFFYPVCYPMEGFFAVDYYRNADKGQPYLKKFNYVDSENYEMIQPAELGEVIKKHAFFYMSLLASTSESYLSYLTRVIERSYSEL